MATTKSTTLTVDRLKEVLRYDQDTGQFWWVQKIGRRCDVSKPAGSPHNKGYWQIKIDGVLHLAHRLAWMYVHGTFPSDLLDHEDRNRLNNRINNLRECGFCGNSRNAGIGRNNKSGYRGVSWWKQNQKWAASIRANGKRIFLGTFDSAEEAAKAYDKAATIHHGDFANINFPKK